MASAKVVRKRFLINREFQLGFIFLAFLFLGLTSIAIGITIPWLFLSGIEVYILTIGIILLAIIFITLCVAFSHSIAGPLFKLSAIIKQVLEGRIPDESFKFRKTDNFQWLANDFNKLIRIIRSHQLEKEDVLSKLENLKNIMKDDQLNTNDCAKAIDETIKNISD